MTARQSLTRAKKFDQQRIDDRWHSCKLHAPGPCGGLVRSTANCVAYPYSLAFILSRGLPGNRRVKAEATP